jgi:serine/threonine-protein kinase
MPTPGTVLLGRFRVESVLGEGGMGIVFSARRIPSQERVAIKVLLPEASAHPEAVPRFVNEAKATMKLGSPHVVKVFEAGTLDIGLPFIVMELLEGTDLGVVLEKRGPLPVAAAVDYLIQAADAIAEAHALGIVHRDLKPTNLFLLERPGTAPMVKVLDFGISKVSNGPQNQALTATGTFLGSPHYMPPEQLKSAKNVDSRADIWALGVILYELLSGKPPFDAGAFGELFMKVLTAEYTPLRTIRPEIPEGLEQVVARCLRRPREERYPDLVEFAQALAPFASPEGARAAQQVGKPRPAEPVATPRRPLASTQLMQDRPQLPAALQAAMQQANAGIRPSSPSVPAAPQHRPPAGSFAPAPYSAPHPPYSAQHPPSSPALPAAIPAHAQVQPSSYNTGVTPAPAPAPRGPSRLVLAFVIGAVLVLLVGAALIVTAMRAHH